MLTAANYYISSFYRLALRNGLDADALLSKAGIEKSLIDAPGDRVDAERLAAFLIDIWDELDDEAMGLSDSRIPRGAFYMMGRLTVHEPNLRQAIEQLIRFYGMVTRSYSMRFSIEGDLALLTFDLARPELDEEHLLAEIHFMCLHRYSSWLIAESIPMSEAFFAHSAPPQAKEYSFLFPGKHVFSAAHYGFSFSKKYLEAEVVQNTDSLKTFVRRCPVELFQQPKTDFSISSDVRLILQRDIHIGIPSANEVANQLNMTGRTLKRRLREEGAPFQQIKDLVRRDTAIRLLTAHSLAVSEVSEKVGYSDPAVFARAFKSWTGLSPSAYRDDFARPQQTKKLQQN